jgi:NAD(P)-dependent dehydrogenase (short-subunit alcohol dehydrogenase family)
MADTIHRVAVVTGASSGIGRATAAALAALGWRIIGLGRNPQRSAAASADIRAASTGGAVDMICSDLSLMAEAERAAREIGELTDRVDLLVNNAGGMAREKVMTAEGLEQNFAGNHLGPFLFTLRLLPQLQQAASTSEPGSVRVINVSSDASEMIPGLNWDDLQSLEDYSPGAAYCSSKLANVLFARGLAKRLEGNGIVALAVHPGPVDSNFVSHVDQRTREYIQTLEMISPEQAADDLVWLATAQAPASVSGAYYHGRETTSPSASRAISASRAGARLMPSSDETSRSVSLVPSGMRVELM